MKKFHQLLLACMLASILFACTKSGKKDDPPIITCIEPGAPEWLMAKKAEYNSCRCLVGIRQGIFQNQPVVEVYLFDPLCDGINVVYKANGTPWFHSGDKDLYQDYRSQVKDERIIWTCQKGSQ